jgi:arginase family enzyme
MSYGALLAAMTSEYVEKEPMLEQTPMKKTSRVRLLPEPGFSAVIAACDLEARLVRLGFETSVADAEATVEQRVAAALAENEVPLLLGRDHTTTLSGLRGAARSVDAFGLIWLDARASFAPPSSGAEPADMVLSRALGYDPALPSIKPRLSPENVALIGLRDVTPHEAEIIRESRVSAFTIQDIDALGIREVMRQALRIALAGTRGLYVSYCPAVTEIPAIAAGSGGITLRETHQAMEITAQTQAMLAMDVVGVGPECDARVNAEAANFIMSCFGKQIL